MTDNAALFYVPDGYDTSGSKLMGRQAAGEAFLRGFAGFADIDRLVCCSHDATCYDRFRQQLAFFRQDTLTEVLRPPLPTQYVSSSDHVSLSKIGCLFYPSPALAPLAWGRRGVQSAAYSLCGITHTTASLAIMDALAELIVAPLEPWDAVICTSHAVKKMVEHFFQGYAADLQQRFGSSVCFRGQLPVIPLGVDCRQFDRRREEYKKGLPATGITAFDELLSSRNEEEVRVLFVGRLAFHAKAHPLPMYLALEEVARRSTKNIHLILAGWFANDSIRQTFVDGAERFCPSVTLTLLDGRLKLVREYVWYTADIFCSLSDNIQETFGITPLEAMAATLPVVVTDWNGYRETVKDGQDGFRIPTAQPPSGCAEHIAQAYANRSLNYDRYIGYLSQTVAVDIDALTEKLLILVESADLREKMGRAGAQHVAQNFDWRHIVRHYQDLWHELGHIRQGNNQRLQRPTVPTANSSSCMPVNATSFDKTNYISQNPSRPDPLALFSHYPTLTLTPDTSVEIRKSEARKEWSTRCSHPLFSFARPVMCDDRTIGQILEKLETQKSISVGELVHKLQPVQKTRVVLTVMWLMKMGVILFPETREAGTKTGKHRC